MRAKLLASVVFVILLCGGAVSAQQSSDELVVEVKDASGRALKSACVTLVPKNGEVIFRKADGKGRVRLKELAPGSYRVVVRVDGYEAQKKEVAVGANTETVAFNMQPRGEQK